MLVYQSITEPPRVAPEWAARWGTLSDALVTCWERGRELAGQNLELAAAARADALVLLSWKGGGNKPIKPNRRFGSFYYLAMWQGVRGEDLSIDTETSLQMRCPRTGTVVTFTEDLARLG